MTQTKRLTAAEKRFVATEAKAQRETWDVEPVDWLE
jgi:hypothetical protein